jgi:hypothetical protein
MSDASEDVAMWIAQIASGLTYGKTVRIGPPQKPSTNTALPNAIPEKCVFVMPGRGATSEAWGGGGGVSKPMVQIWIRGTRNKYEEARDLAFNIFDSMDKQPPPGYFEARSQYSQPELIQQDEVGCFEFLINLDLRKQV